MACIEDEDCQEENNLVCAADEGVDKVCLCDSGFIEDGSRCLDGFTHPGDPCDARMMKCAKKTNMICDGATKPPRCTCMLGMTWQTNRCVALYDGMASTTITEDAGRNFTEVANSTI